MKSENSVYSFNSNFIHDLIAKNFKLRFTLLSCNAIIGVGCVNMILKIIILCFLYIKIINAFEYRNLKDNQLLSFVKELNHDQNLETLDTPENMDTNYREIMSSLMAEICKKCKECDCNKDIGLRHGKLGLSIATGVEKIIDEIEELLEKGKNNSLDNNMLSADNVYTDRYTLTKFNDTRNNLRQGSIEGRYIKKWPFLNAVISKLGDINIVVSNNNNNNNNNNRLATKRKPNEPFITIEEFVTLRKPALKYLRKKIINYIKGNNINMQDIHMTKKMKTQIKALKLKYGPKYNKENVITKDVISIIDGQTRTAKMYPVTKNTNVLNDIYIPYWMFYSILHYKEEYLRSRLIPLTSQQKVRMENKIRSQKHYLKPKKKLNLQLIPKVSLRRNTDPNFNKYGVPFALDIQGLGQLNY
ncbi:uncharacterized protein LOC126970007 [Leptidea sinapis]|uniref:uncharacterized protein LOC126970007 n=1 Tax=Leptidea sinapis TaxID=189913 RepID=UPI0021C45978|nr:uncharacterized protein LOC126970007 [Leptidea sinapis]